MKSERKIWEILNRVKRKENVIVMFLGFWDKT